MLYYQGVKTPREITVYTHSGLGGADCSVATGHDASEEGAADIDVNNPTAFKLHVYLYTPTCL